MPRQWRRVAVEIHRCVRRVHSIAINDGMHVWLRWPDEVTCRDSQERRLESAGRVRSEQGDLVVLSAFGWAPSLAAREATPRYPLAEQPKPSCSRTAFTPSLTADTTPRWSHGPHHPRGKKTSYFPTTPYLSYNPRAYLMHKDSWIEKSSEASPD